MLVKEMLNVTTDADVNGPVVHFEMPERIRGVVQVAITAEVGTMGAATHFDVEGRLSENHGWFEVASNLQTGANPGTVAQEDIAMFPQMRVRIDESGVGASESITAVAYIGN